MSRCISLFLMVCLASFAEAQSTYTLASQQLQQSYNLMRTRLDGTGSYITNTLARLDGHEWASGYEYENVTVRAALEYQRGPLLELNRLAPGSVEFQQAVEVQAPFGTAEYDAATARMTVMASTCAIIATVTQAITDVVAALDAREQSDYDNWVAMN